VTLMSTPPTTLVTAAAGKTGRHTALALLSRGLPGMAPVMRRLTKSVVAPGPNRKRYLRTFHEGASVGALSIDSDLWQNTHDPDQIRHAQLPRIGVTSAVAR
jgi:hypothetical protein